MEALSSRAKLHARRKALAETDAMAADVNARGAALLAAVGDATNTLAQAVSKGDLGGSAAETQALLDKHRQELMGKRKPA